MFCNLEVWLESSHEDRFSNNGVHIMVLYIVCYPFQNVLFLRLMFVLFQ